MVQSVLFNSKRGIFSFERTLPIPNLIGHEQMKYEKF